MGIGARPDASTALPSAPSVPPAPLLEVVEPTPGVAWQGHFCHFWPGYRRWFLARQRGTPLSLAACRGQLGRHMPSLVPTWERLVEIARDSGAGDLAARFLTLYRPPPFLTGCSILVTRDRATGEPILIRNYDYDPALWNGVVWRSSWSGHGVLALTDCLWGALDGINAHGLAVALAFGGRRTVGDGFAIPLIVRYLLETCRNTDEARAALDRVSSHMSYNLVLLDAEGSALRAELAPDHAARFRDVAWCTNHQGDGGDWPAYERASATRERSAWLAEASQSGLEDPVATFTAPPLFTSDFERSFATLYTAVWRPTRRSGAVWVRGQAAVELEALPS